MTRRADQDPLIRLFKHMGELIDENAAGQRTADSVHRASVIAAEDAVSWGLVSGPLWEEGGSDLLSSAYAFKTGMDHGGFLLAGFAALAERETAEGGEAR